MSAEPWVFGELVSTNPIVTYSLHGKHTPLGIAGAFPELFKKRHALHLVGFSWSLEGLALEEFIRDAARLETELHDNRLVMVANTDYEAFLLSGAGRATIVGSTNILTDDAVFRPVQSSQEMFDAVYIARFSTYKRHRLARCVKGLMLIHGGRNLDAGPEAEGEARRDLRDAWFANDTLGAQDPNRKLDHKTIADLLGRCRVGLCLSAVEGAMRAAMEYLLCGLTVVSTESRGGRDRYLLPAYSRIVPDDPQAVAEGVREMISKDVPKTEVRKQVVQILDFERHNFLMALNRICLLHFGVKDLFTSMAPFLKASNRPASKLIASVHGP